MLPLVNFPQNDPWHLMFPSCATFFARVAVQHSYPIVGFAIRATQPAAIAM